VKAEAPGQVVVDGIERGSAPIDLELPDGEHLVTVQFDAGGESSLFARTLSGRSTGVELAPSEHRRRFDEGESGLRFSIGLAPEIAFVELGDGGFLGVGGRVELWLRSAVAPSVDIGGGFLGGVVVYLDPATTETQPSDPPLQPVFGLAFETRIHSLDALSSGLGLQIDLALDPTGLRLRDAGGEQSATALGFGPRLVPIALRLGSTRQIELTATVAGGPYVLLLDGEGGFRTSASLGGHYVF